MAVGFKIGSVTSEVGTSDFLSSFFFTVSGNLEPGGWGTKFPVLLNVFFQGELGHHDASQAMAELQIIEKELARLPPEKVIWDINHREKLPPWGTNISADIRDLSNYFVTSTGRGLIPLLRECLEELRDAGGALKIVSY